MCKILTAPLVVTVHEDCKLTSKTIMKIVAKHLSLRDSERLFHEFGLACGHIFDEVQNVTRKLAPEAYASYASVFS